MGTIKRISFIIRINHGRMERSAFREGFGNEICWGRGGGRCGGARARGVGLRGAGVADGFCGGWEWIGWSLSRGIGLIGKGGGPEGDGWRQGGKRGGEKGVGGAAGVFGNASRQ